MNIIKNIVLISLAVSVFSSFGAFAGADVAFATDTDGAAANAPPVFTPYSVDATGDISDGVAKAKPNK